MEYNNQQFTQQMVPPQKIVMVTPFNATDDNNNPMANKLCLVAVILLALSKTFPVINSVFMASYRFFDAPYIPISFGYLLFIAAIVVLIVAKVKYPGNSVAKGLLIGVIANFVISLVIGLGSVAAIFGILSEYSGVDFSEFVWELTDILGL